MAKGLDKSDFRVGDVVYWTAGDVTGALGTGMFRQGDAGVVCDLSRSVTVGVRWDALRFRGHSCHGNCREDSGWYVLPEWISRENPEPVEPEPGLSAADIEELLGFLM